MPFLKTYQYNDPKVREEDDSDGSGTTYWIAAHSEEEADAYAALRQWEKSGGQIFNVVQTTELLDYGRRAGRHRRGARRSGAGHRAGDR